MSEFIQSQTSSPVSSQTDSAKKTFLIRTYSHLMLCVAIFGACLFFMVTNKVIMSAIIGIYTLPFASFIILAGIIGLSFLTTFLVSSASKPVQYMGLVLYPVMQAFLFVPMILSFLGKGAESSLINASWLTVVVFAVLSLVVFVTKPDLGFLGKFIMFASIGSFVCIVLSFVVPGFVLGTWFTIAMIALAAGYILYETSEIMNTNDTENYVGAGLALFASVAMLFFYILRFFNSRN
jgi:uncharacterized protein